MYQVEIVQTALAPMVGINQPNDPGYPPIDSDLTTSPSGHYLQAAHPLCTIENIRNVAPEFLGFTFPTYTAGNDYRAGEIVLFSGKNYKAKVAVTVAAADPDGDSANWLLVDPFSDWLRTTRNEAAVNLINDWVTRRKYNSLGSSLVQTMQLFKGPGSYQDKIIKEDRFVGWIIRTKGSEGLLARINEIGFQVDTAQDELNFYLYHSSRDQPVAVIPVELLTDAGYVWYACTQAIGYMQGAIGSEGTFYFGYYENDLEGQAINKPWNFNIEPCLTCMDYNIYAWRTYSKYVGIQPFSVDAAYLDGSNNLFDTTKVKLVYDQNWGMNMAITVECDISAVIARSKNILAPALRSRFALEILTKIAFSTRITGVGEQAKRLAMADLDEREKDGDGNRVNSFINSYFMTLDGMDLDLGGFNEECLPCSNKNRIRHRAI